MKRVRIFLYALTLLSYNAAWGIPYSHSQKVNFAPELGTLKLGETHTHTHTQKRNLTCSMTRW